MSHLTDEGSEAQRVVSVSEGDKQKMSTANLILDYLTPNPILVNTMPRDNSVPKLLIANSLKITILVFILFLTLANKTNT